MYVVKGSWVGQTFALATTSDSGGRKSRIRRSKEERKAMVESFIKRYQSSNDGNFPSLNLTHKEVGGSFYTVRDIVREIIQENKVLGPARHSPLVLRDDNVVAQYSLGSIPVEPQGSAFQAASEFDAMAHNLEKECAELTHDNNGHYINHQYLSSMPSCGDSQADKISEVPDEEVSKRSENENVGLSSHEDCSSLEVSWNSTGQCLDEYETKNGIFMDVQTSEISLETNELLAEGLLVSKSLEADEELEVMKTCKAELSLPTEEVIVETFPLRHVMNEGDIMISASTDSGNLNGNLSVSGEQMFELSYATADADKIRSLVGSSDQKTTEETGGCQLLMSSRTPCIVSEHVEVNGKVVQHEEIHVTNAASEKMDVSPLKEDIVVLYDLADQKASHNGSLSKPAEQKNFQSTNSPKGTNCLENSNGLSHDDKEANVLVANRSDTQRYDKAVAGSSQPLDRINLQSWERADSRQQPNSLLAIFKTFVDLFVKFWSK